MTEPTLGVDRLTPAIGARIEGVDLSAECSATLLNRLYELLIEHLVLFLPDQALTPDTLLAFAETFGELDTRTMSTPRAGLRARGVAGKRWRPPAQYRCLAHGSHL